MAQKYLSRSLVLLGLMAGASLAACTSPGPIPTGYTHHNKAYKSANPPPADVPKERKAAVEQAKASPMPAPEPMPAAAPQLTATQADQLRLAIYQLAESLTRRAGMPPKPVFVMTPDTQSPIYETMGDHLREALRHLNYRVSDIPDNAYAVTYSVQPNAGMPSAGGGKPGNTRVSLLVYDRAGDGAKLLTEEADIFFVEGGSSLPPVVAPMPVAPMPPVMSSGPMSTPPAPAMSPMPSPAPRPPMPGPAR